MTDRDRALDILRKARDLIADRLTEQILENEDSLFDDARGESYLSDIESMYERFGLRLSHLNQLINNLPGDTDTIPMESATFGTNAATSELEESGTIEEASSSSAALIGPLIVSPPALPAPRVDDSIEIEFPTFQRFVSQVSNEEILAAARTLASLLDISEARGVQCSRIFLRRYEENQDFALKVLQLRGEVISSSYNSALMLMAECFGLVGIEAIGVLQTLRARFTE